MKAIIAVWEINESRFVGYTTCVINLEWCGAAICKLSSRVIGCAWRGVIIDNAGV